MRHTFVYIFLSLTVIFSGCEKFLDEDPDMRVDIDSPDKLQALLTSAYPKGNYLMFAEVVSDNVEDKQIFNAMHNDQPYPDLYRWADIPDDETGTPTDFWNRTYAAISAANHALDVIDKEEVEQDSKQYKGEALISRAYNHFILSIFFAKPYLGGKNGEALGIPYPTEPNDVVFGEYQRETLADTYEKIEKDLLEGLPLVQGGTWKVPKYHFTPAAANAFAARFYLFKEDWDKVIEHVSAIVPSGNFRPMLRPYTSNMLDYTFAQWQQEFNKADKDYNLLLTETYSVFQRASGLGGARYGFGESKLGIHNATTVYGAPFRSNNVIGVWTAPNYMTRKFYEYFHYTNVAEGIGFPYVMQALFTVDEALINRAEAYVQKGQYDLAIKDLNDFASTRITNYSTSSHGLTLEKVKNFYPDIVDDKKAMLTAILDIKQKAFMQEGIRWMDILRHELPVVHNHYDDRGFETFEVLEATDARRVFQLPVTAISQGLEPNER